MLGVFPCPILPGSGPPEPPLLFSPIRDLQLPTGQLPALIRQFLLLVGEDPACRFEPDGGFYATPNVKGKARPRLDEIDSAFRAANASVRRSRPGSSTRGTWLTEGANLK